VLGEGGDWWNAVCWVWARKDEDGFTGDFQFELTDGVHCPLVGGTGPDVQAVIVLVCRPGSRCHAPLHLDGRVARV
jgi:hypothetical protein